MSILLLLFFVLLIYFIESHPSCMAATPGHQEPFPFHICRKKHLVIIVILLRMWLSITRFVITILPLSLGILHKSMLRTNDGLFVRLIPSSPRNLIILIRSHLYLYVTISPCCNFTTGRGILWRPGLSHSAGGLICKQNIQHCFIDHLKAQGHHHQPCKCNYCVKYKFYSLGVVQKMSLCPVPPVAWYLHGNLNTSGRKGNYWRVGTRSRSSSRSPPRPRPPSPSCSCRTWSQTPGTWSGTWTWGTHCHCQPISSDEWLLTWSEPRRRRWPMFPRAEPEGNLPV